MRSRTAWQALALQPVGFLRSTWPWRALLYLLSGVVTGALAMVLLFTTAAAGLLTLIVGVGVVLLVIAALMGLPFARLERWRLRLVDLDGIQAPHRTVQGSGWRRWLRSRLSESATWRELILLIVSVTALWWVDIAVLGLAFVLPVMCIAAPFNDPPSWPWAIFGVILFATAPYSITAWAAARATLCRIVLAPRDTEVDPDLTRIVGSQARLLDAFEVERAQIERDLHDGAQQRLVALQMKLGLAALDVPDGSALQEDISSMQEELTQALADLRHLVRGLNPQVLADNGLVAAIEEVVSRHPVPVALDLQLPDRLPPPVETAAYYAITEALTNVAKHSRSTHVDLSGRQHHDMLVLHVRDNGIGGANADRGGGITGLADRLAVLNGRMHMSSPPGGPTLVVMEIPCPFG